MKNGDEKKTNSLVGQPSDQVASYIDDHRHEAVVWYNDKLIALEKTGFQAFVFEQELKSGGGISISREGPGRIVVRMNPITAKSLTLKDVVDKLIKLLMDSLRD